jgi:hypothetical protein
VEGVRIGGGDAMGEVDDYGNGGASEGRGCGDAGEKGGGGWGPQGHSGGGRQGIRDE